MEAFIHGVMLALGLIIPLGAQNVFVFSQGASQPTLVRALPVVITASLCDTLLITSAVLGLSLVVIGIPWLKTAIMTVGVLFLIYVGWSTWKGSFGLLDHRRETMPAGKQIILAASVSLLNPHAILDTLGVIGTNSLNYAAGDKWIFTGATLLVSWIWFLGLALLGRFMVSFERYEGCARHLNKISALIIWGIALYMAISLIPTAV